MAENGRILEVEHLSQHFVNGHGKNRAVVRAVDDVSFFVRPAEVFGLVGESGCGKTTTGRAIIRLLNPTSGTVRFDGREISGKMTKDLSRYLSENMAMIFQDPIESLNPRMTIEEIVGEIEDEFDPDNRYLNQLGEREWMVDGRYSIDDAMELGWPIEDNAEYETIAGFVLELADRLPRPGDSFQKDGYTFTVQSMRGRRLSMLRVEQTGEGEARRDAEG